MFYTFYLIVYFNLRVLYFYLIVYFNLRTFYCYWNINSNLRIFLLLFNYIPRLTYFRAVVSLQTSCIIRHSACCFPHIYHECCRLWTYLLCSPKSSQLFMAFIAFRSNKLSSAIRPCKHIGPGCCIFTNLLPPHCCSQPPKKKKKKHIGYCIPTINLENLPSRRFVLANRSLVLCVDGSAKSTAYTVRRIHARSCSLSASRSTSLTACSGVVLVRSYTNYAASAYKYASHSLLRAIFSAVFPLFGRLMYKSLGANCVSTTLAAVPTAAYPCPLI